MYPLTAAAAAALTRSHTAPVAVILEHPSLAEPVPLTFTDGQVTVDGRRAIRRQLSLTLVDDGRAILNGQPITPRNQRTHPLGIFAGGLLRVYRGVTVAGTDELIPVGVFVPTSVSVALTDDGPQVVVEGDDVARLLSQPWTRQWVIPAGTNVGDALTDLLTFAGLPTVTVSPTTVTTGAVTFGTFDDVQSPWDDATRLAQSVGYCLYVDPVGAAVAGPYPAPDDPPALTLSTGTSGLIVDGPSLVYADEAVVNGVKVNVSNTDADTPLLGEAWAAPGSALDPAGPYGDNSATVDNSLIVTQAQAQRAAEGLLASVIGTGVQLAVIPQPHLDAGDVVRLTATEVGLDVTGVIDEVTVPLLPDQPMTMTVRTLGNAEPVAARLTPRSRSLLDVYADAYLDRYGETY